MFCCHVDEEDMLGSLAEIRKATMLKEMVPRLWATYFYSIKFSMLAEN
jgi:hypothetical protein